MIALVYGGFMGNLAGIARLLMALYAAYIARNCPALGEKGKTFFWTFSMALFLLVCIAEVVALLEFIGLV